MRYLLFILSLILSLPSSGRHDLIALSRAINSAIHDCLQATSYLLTETDPKAKPKKAPPFNGEALGTDPAKCPGEGFE